MKLRSTVSPFLERSIICETISAIALTRDSSSVRLSEITPPRPGRGSLRGCVGDAVAAAAIGESGVLFCDVVLLWEENVYVTV